MLLALPHDSISQEALLLGQSGTEELLFGSNTFVTVPLVEESDDLLSVVALGIDAKVLVVDVNDDVLLSCREYDPVTDHLTGILGFSHDHLNSLPEPTQLVALVTEWLLGRSDDRTGFYTAQEDLAEPSPKVSRSSAAGQLPTGKKANTAKRVSNAAVAEQLAALTAQLQLLSKRQDQLEKGKQLYCRSCARSFCWSHAQVASPIIRAQEPERGVTDGASQSFAVDRTSSKGKSQSSCGSCCRCGRRRTLRCLAAWTGRNQP